MALRCFSLTTCIAPIVRLILRPQRRQGARLPPCNVKKNLGALSVLRFCTLQQGVMTFTGGTGVFARAAAGPWYAYASHRCATAPRRLKISATVLDCASMLRLH